MQSPEGLEDSPFKLKVLKYPKNCSLHNTLIPNLAKPPRYILKFFRSTGFSYVQPITMHSLAALDWLKIWKTGALLLRKNLSGLSFRNLAF